jgi:hypothetical protein
VKTLSKQHEDRLIGAVKRAVAHVDDDGMTPNEAIEKVARAGKWNREWIKLAAHAYNTGRQTAQREVGASLMDKLAEFPLVDPAEVIGKIWPSSVKSAADIHRETGVSSEYDRPPAWLSQSSSTGHLKTAEFKLVDTPPPPLEPDPDEKMARAYNIHLDLKRAVEDARIKAGAAKDRLIGAMGELGEYFRKHARDRHSFSDIEHAVRAYYPGSAQTLMDYVHQRNGGKEVRAADTPVSTRRMDRNAAPFNLLDRCVECGRQVKQAEAAHAAALAAMSKQGEDLRPFGRTPSPAPASQVHSLIPEETAPKQASVLGGAVLGATSQDLLRRAMSDTPETTKELREDELRDLTDPLHEAELRKIRAQALLSELMTDPVIGSYDPAQVFKAYNEISQTAPRASMQAMAVRPMLRRYLQGNMEPFEAKEVTDIEKGMRDIERPTPSLGGLPESSADALS